MITLDLVRNRRIIAVDSADQIEAEGVEANLHIILILEIVATTLIPRRFDRSPNLEGNLGGPEAENMVTVNDRQGLFLIDNCVFVVVFVLILLVVNVHDFIYWYSLFFYFGASTTGFFSFSRRDASFVANMEAGKPVEMGRFMTGLLIWLGVSHRPHT